MKKNFSKMFASLTFSIAATCVVGVSGLAQAETVKNYKRVVKKVDNFQQHQKNSLMEKLERASKKPRDAYLKILEKQNPGLIKQLRREARHIMKTDASQKWKQAQIMKLLDRYETTLQQPYRFIQRELREFRMYATRLLRSFNCLFDAYFNIVCSDLRTPDVVIPEDMLFEGSYAEKEEVMDSALIGFGTARADESNGEVELSSTAVDAGTFYAKAGMIETVDVPPQIDRVKVTVKTTMTHSITAFAILGITWGDATAYLRVFGDNAFQCDQTHTLATAFAPILWVANAAGTQVTTLTCEFTPNSVGGQYVIAGGASSGTSAALPAATLSSVHGEVDEIRVQFILE